MLPLFICSPLSPNNFVLSPIFSTTCSSFGNEQRYVPSCLNCFLDFCWWGLERWKTGKGGAGNTLSWYAKLPWMSLLSPPSALSLLLCNPLKTVKKKKKPACLSASIQEKSPFSSELWFYLRMDDFLHLSGRIPACSVGPMGAHKKLNRQY